MQNIRTSEEVFPPNGQPTYSYVSRQFENEYGIKESREELLKKALKEKGMVISIAGPSKSGKTALVHKVAADVNRTIIKVSGIDLDDEDDFWSIVSKKSGMPLERKIGNSETNGHSLKVATGLKAGIPGLQSDIKIEGEGKGEQKSEQHMTHGKWTSDEVSDFIKSKNGILLIDDFHYTSQEKQKKIAKIIKHAAENNDLKICVAQIIHKGDAAIRANPDLDGRIFRLDFQYWSQEDLKQIGSAFNELNVEVSDDVIEFLAKEAAGSPQLMQRFCKNLCDLNNIEDNNHPKLKIAPNSLADLDKVFISGMQNVNKSSLLKEIEQGLPPKGKKRGLYETFSGEMIDVYECCILAITLDPPKMELTINEINERATKSIKGKRPTKQSLGKTLKRIAGIADKAAAKSNNGMKFIDVEEDATFHFIDPYFFYFARWNPKYYKRRREKLNV